MTAITDSPLRVAVASAQHTSSGPETTPPLMIAPQQLRGGVSSFLWPPAQPQQLDRHRDKRHDGDDEPDVCHITHLGIL